MSTRRDELLRAAREATANYAFCCASADNARRAMALGFGSVADLTVKTQIEHTSYHRWLRASEALVATEPKSPRQDQPKNPAPSPPVLKPATSQPVLKTAPPLTARGAIAQALGSIAAVAAKTHDEKLARDRFQWAADALAKYL